MKTLPTIALAVALLTGACGSQDGSEVSAAPDVVIDETDAGESPDNTEAPTVADQSDEDAAIAFVACMRDNGVDLADPVVEADGSVALGGPAGGAGNGRPEGFREAREVCGELLDGVNFGGGAGGFDAAEAEDSLLAFAQCLRDQGLDVDDPDLDSLGSGGGRGAGLFGENFDPQDPANEAAVETCRDSLGEFALRGGGAPRG